MGPDATLTPFVVFQIITGNLHRIYYLKEKPRRRFQVIPCAGPPQVQVGCFLGCAISCPSQTLPRFLGRLMSSLSWTCLGNPVDFSQINCLLWAIFKLQMQRRRHKVQAMRVLPWVLSSRLCQQFSEYLLSTKLQGWGPGFSWMNWCKVPILRNS